MGLKNFFTRKITIPNSVWVAAIGSAAFAPIWFIAGLVIGFSCTDKMLGKFPQEPAGWCYDWLMFVIYSPFILGSTFAPHPIVVIAGIAITLFVYSLILIFVIKSLKFFLLRKKHA